MSITVERHGGVATIFMNRPEALNAFEENTPQEFQSILREIDTDDEVHVVVITGMGRAFSAGADLKYLTSIRNDPEKLLGWLRGMQHTFNAVDNLGKPVIAAVNGYAIAGGLELVLACDLAIAAEEAVMADQHPILGIVPGGGMTQRLPRLVGLRKAKEIMLTGDRISGTEAAAIGLVNKAVPLAKLQEAVDVLTGKLVDKNPVAARLTKRLVAQGLEASMDVVLDLEVQTCALNIYTSGAAHQGLRNFVERQR